MKKNFEAEESENLIKMGCKRHLTWCTYTGRRFFLLTQTNKPSSSLIITCYTFDIHEAYQHTPDLALSSLYWAATSLNFIPPLIFSKASRHLDCFSHSICRTWKRKKNNHYSKFNNQRTGIRKPGEKFGQKSSCP